MHGIVSGAGEPDNDFTKGHSAIIISTVHSSSWSGLVFSVLFSLITVATGVRMLLSAKPAITVVLNITTKAIILMVPDIKPSLFRDTCTFRLRRVHCYTGKTLKPPLLLIASLGCKTWIFLFIENNLRMLRICLYDIFLVIYLALLCLASKAWYSSLSMLDEINVIYHGIWREKNASWMIQWDVLFWYIICNARKYFTWWIFN